MTTNSAISSNLILLYLGFYILPNIICASPPPLLINVAVITDTFDYTDTIFPNVSVAMEKGSFAFPLFPSFMARLLWVHNTYGCVDL